MFKAGQRAFWAAYAVFFIFFLFLTAFGSKLWSLSLPIQVAGIALSVGLLIIWAIWRGVKLQTRLPKTGLEWLILLACAVILLSLAFSPDPSQGTLRSGWLIGIIIVFYFLLDSLSVERVRWGALAAFLSTSGVLLLLGLFETYLWYSQWWQKAGLITLLPPEPYRFQSVLTSASPLIAFANMGIFFALLAIWKVKKPIVRVLCIYWLLIYAIAFPFSSSRGGWMGLAVTVFTILALFIYEKKYWQAVRGWSRRRKLMGMAIATIACVLLIAAVYVFMLAFGAHSSRGGNAFGLTGRETIWANALDVWKAHPFLGAGPGRFYVEYRLTAGGASPAWWAPHAHNTSLQFLAEFGLAGLLVWLALVTLGLIGAWRYYRASPAQIKPWNAAALAGLLGLLAHLNFDEFSTWPTVTVAAAFLAAWLGSAGGTFPRHARRSMRWVWLPALGLIFWAGWGVYTYEPFLGWSQALKSSGGYRAAAERIHQSVLRDSHNSYYTVAEALTWAASWGRTQDPADLQAARTAFEITLQQEPGYANLWANLAVLEGYAGDTANALAHWDRALLMAPRDYTYPLNRAWVKEHTGDLTGAEQDYRLALTLAPGTVDHPFWQSSSLRQLVAQKQRAAAPAALTGTYWQQAQAQMQNGNLEAARLNLARSWAMDEPLAARLVVSGQLYEKMGETDEAMKEYAKLTDLYGLPGLNLDFGRIFTSSAMVPGFLHLDPDWGQVAVLERMVADFKKQGLCAQMQNAWKALKFFQNGGGLAPVTFSPSCGN